MIISYEHNFCFVKTRKTAGSTLEKLVLPYLREDLDICTGSPRDDTPRLNTNNTNGHLRFNNLLESWNLNPNKLFSFSIERNPWDKVVSAYYWHKKIKPGQFENMEFDTYVENRHGLLPTDWYLYYPSEKLKVRKVYKYEERYDMYADLNNRFGFKITKDQVNLTRLKSDVRKNKEYKNMYNSTSKKVIAKIFEKEIETFKYTYD